MSGLQKAIDDAEHCKNLGNKRVAARDHKAALEHYEDGISKLKQCLPRGQTSRRSELFAALWSNSALCHLSLNDNWAALLAANIAIGVLPVSKPTSMAAKAHFRLGDAAARLGFLSVALEQLQFAAMLSPSDTAKLIAVKKRLDAMRSGETALRQKAFEQELQVLTRALGDEKAKQELSAVTAKLETPEGRANLIRLGLLDETETEKAIIIAGCCYRALLQSSKKLFQAFTSLSMNNAVGAPPSGCVEPATLEIPGQPQLLQDSHLETLRSERLVVRDGALPAEVIEAAAKEVRAMVAQGLLSSDKDDVCNPGTQSADLVLWDEENVQELEKMRPALLQCIRALEQTPSILSKALGLELRVPHRILLASYPKGSQYRRHFDSYGGRDNPRLITVLLYLSWQPETGGALRTFAPNANAAERETDSELYKDIEPCAGRVVTFMAQEVEHQVMPSDGERYALTLWIWDVRKDEMGR